MPTNWESQKEQSEAGRTDTIGIATLQKKNATLQKEKEANQITKMQKDMALHNEIRMQSRQESLKLSFLIL